MPVQVTVVGGGIIGLCCAATLLARGHAVTIFDDPSSPESASWNNAGHIATEQVIPLASPATLRSLPRRLFVAGGPLDLPPSAIGAWLPFAARLLAAARPSKVAVGTTTLAALLRNALGFWRDMAALLGEPALVRDGGHLIVWEDPNTARAGRLAWEQADTGLAAIGDATAQDAALLSVLLRGERPLGGVARFTGSGAISDLAALSTRLRAFVAERGGKIVARKAALANVGGRIWAGGVRADVVLIAAGVGSGALLAPFGHRVPIIAERGYHIRATAGEDWPIDAPPIVFEDRSMIVTRYRETVQAASFVEFARNDTPADPRKWERLERHVAALGLPMRPPFTRWMGARPTLPDYLPAIGRSERATNLFYAFGHQHLGLTLAPVTAGLIADLIEDRAPAIDLARMSLSRFDAPWRR